MSAGTATVTLQPATAGTAIDLGTETIGKLSLTDAELDRITARTIVIGNDESGPITISAPLNHPATNTLALIGNTTFAANSGYTFQIGGTTAGTQHDQITVMGTLTIDSTAAFATTAANSFVPSAGLSFTLINNDTAADAVMGAFQNLPEGSVLTNFLGAGQAASLTYRGADGNDVVVLTTLEYGDAPAPYPTTLAADGARHIPFGPTLGSLRDVESDGALSTLADGDDNAETDDEDGITFRATIVADASVTTRASVEVDLQSADPDGNFLDGFLDLNGDGDWTDAGEHIIDDVNLGTTDGLYVVTFTIPVDVGANVVAGETFARFRLSTTGELDSTGVATDGEVEDYAVTIVQSGDFTDAVVDTPEDGGELTVEIVNGSIIVRRGEDVLLDTPLANLETLTINGSDATDDTLALDFTNGTPLPSGGLFFNGGSGGDDIITVTGGSVVTATYTFENLTDGTINYLIGGQTFTIDYTGLEPVIDNLEAVNRIFDFTGGAELIELIDTNGADGMMTITSTLGESIEFVNPTGSLTINGGSGNDTITSLDAGLTVRTNIHGGDGDDTIALGNGIVVGNVTGGAGIDLLDYSAFTTSVTVNLAAGTATNTSSVATIENVTGGSGADFLDGGVGNDTLKSGAGDDELSGGAGIDSIDGGIGTDCLIEVVTGNITITDTKITGLGSDKILNVECFEFSGDDRNNLLDASKYTLGSVVLRGNGGNDTLLGGSRNDTLDGGEGFDIIKQSASVNQTITGDSATGAETDSLVSIEGAQLISLGRTGLRLDASGFFGKAALDGTAGNDTLLGGGGVSTLNGNAGHDLIVVGSAVESLTGGAGNDTLIGNAGNDVLRGGDGSDSLLGNSGDDRIFGDSGSDQMFGGTSQDLMDGGAGNDTMLGEAGHDTIKGGAGNDGMSGGAGDDFMDGESGDDTLLGGSGSDTLRTATGRDRALGEEGNDRIESLSDDTISGGAGDNVFIGPHAKIDEAFDFDFSKLLV